MSKAGERLLRSVGEARRWARGEHVEGLVVHRPEAPDVREIRERLGLTQAAFAARFGLRLDAVEGWEQGRRRPSGAARAFLKVIDREPEAVQRALAS